MDDFHDAENSVGTRDAENSREGGDYCLYP